MDQEMLTPNNNNASKTGSVSVYYCILKFLLKITLISQFKISAVIGTVRSLVWLYQLFVLMINSWPWCKAPRSPHTCWMPFVLLCALCCAYCNHCLVIIWEQNQPPSYDLIDPIFTFADVSFFIALIMFSDASMCLCAAQGLCWL